MEAVSGFHHVAMNVKDFDKSVQFYTKILGMTKGKSWETAPKRAIMLNAGNGNYVELFESADNSAASGPILHFALKTDDCDGLLAKVREYGAEITTEVADVDIQSDPVYPVRIAFFKGPDGEIIELFQERKA